MGNLFRSFSKHNKVSANKSSSDSRKKSPAVPEPISPDEEPDEPGSNLDPSNSPFQRDFYPAPHQVLVSLEKSRPRRSNIRRSSRIEKQKKNESNNKPHSSQGDNIRDVYPKPTAENPVTLINYESKLNEENEEVSQHSSIDHLPALSGSDDWTDDTDSTKEQSTPAVVSRVDQSWQDSLDDMSADERREIAKSRVSQIVLKMQQQPIPSFMAPLDSSHGRPQSGIHQYESSESDAHAGQKMNSNQTLNRSEFSSLTSVNELDDEKVSKEHQQNDEQFANEQEDDHTNTATQQQEVISRPKPKKLHGNPLLIDELKKRQSTMYQSTVQSTD